MLLWSMSKLPLSPLHPLENNVNSFIDSLKTRKSFQRRLVNYINLHKCKLRLTQWFLHSRTLRSDGSGGNYFSAVKFPEFSLSLSLSLCLSLCLSVSLSVSLSLSLLCNVYLVDSFVFQDAFCICLFVSRSLSVDSLFVTLSFAAPTISSQFISFLSLFIHLNTFGTHTIISKL